MTDKTFILGVGAQKAGTTWLYHYLAAAAGFAKPAMKEFHIWDTLLTPHCHQMRVKDANRDADDKSRWRWALQQDPDSYFTYFSDLLQPVGKTITCDVTPSYAMLPPAGFDRITAGFSGRGITVKTVYLMRDPVERCWSAVRMNHGKKLGSTAVEDDVVLAHALTPGATVRTRYDLTLATLDAAIASDALYVGLYEEMHTEARIDALSQFCGIPSQPSLAQKRVGASAKVTPLQPETTAKIARHFREVYDAVARRFPQAETLWPGYQYL